MRRVLLVIVAEETSGRRRERVLSGRAVLPAHGQRFNQQLGGVDQIIYRHLCGKFQLKSLGFHSNEMK